MFLTIIMAFIGWPQILLIIGLVLLFFVVMRIPKAVKDVQKDNSFKDARDQD